MNQLVAEKSISTRNAIIEAAHEQVYKVGFRKMSMEDIAHAAGLSRAAIYLHFKDKADLIIAVMKWMGAVDLEHLKSIARQKGSNSEKAREFLREHILVKMHRCQKVSSSLDELFTYVRQAFLNYRVEMNRQVAGVLTEILIQGRMDREFIFDDAYRTAETLVYTTLSFMPYSLSNEELGDLDLITEKLDAVIDMGLRSISAKTPAINSEAEHKRHPRLSRTNTGRN